MHEGFYHRFRLIPLGVSDDKGSGDVSARPLPRRDTKHAQRVVGGRNLRQNK